TARAVAERARGLAARQQAVANEAGRLHALLQQGTFVSRNDAERALAFAEEEEANVAEEQAKLAATSVAEGDCILRAPFDGEVATRNLDPGGFARPTTAVVSVIDRSTVRLSAEAPESDYDLVGPGTPVRVRAFATGA